VKYLFFIVILLPYLLASDFSQENNETKIKSSDLKSGMDKWLDHDFGLKPYRANYLLPYGYADKKYNAPLPTVEYENSEAELQVSLQLRVARDLLGLNEEYFLSYTQKSFWQIYAKSSPFRETNYNPEAFVIFPINDEDNYFRFISLKFAIAHISNGQPDTRDVLLEDGTHLGNLSRSINFVYTTLRLQHKSLFLDLKTWLPLPEDPEENDNPDLMDYTGYASAKVTYFYNENMFTFKIRGSTKTGNGYLEGTYSYPVLQNYFYLKVFSGYGESLIDYNNYINKVSVGFSFSR
jgi:phospholipase A1